MTASVDAGAVSELIRSSIFGGLSQTRFCIRQPRRNLQIKFTRQVSRFFKFLPGEEKRTTPAGSMSRLTFQWHRCKHKIVLSGAAEERTKRLRYLKVHSCDGDSGKQRDKGGSPKNDEKCSSAPLENKIDGQDRFQHRKGLRANVSSIGHCQQYQCPLVCHRGTQKKLFYSPSL